MRVASESRRRVSWDIRVSRWVVLVYERRLVRGFAYPIEDIL